jgi:hypothetical protein
VIVPDSERRHCSLFSIETEISKLDVNDGEQM